MLLIAALTSGAADDALARNAVDAPFWTGHPDTTQFVKQVEARLSRAQEAITRLTAAKGSRTVENTLRPYDDALIELDAVSSQSSLMENVHPEVSLRTAAEKMSQKAAAFNTALSLNRDVYDALAAIPLDGLDAVTKYYVEKELRDFRLAGVDRDEATRKRITALREELVQIGQEFSRNIRDDDRTITVKTADELAGLPQDYIDRHKPEADGEIRLTMDYPDAIPVFQYAKSGDLRRRMYMSYSNRAFPANMETLKRMMAKRNELATTLGFKSWAEYITADKMVGSDVKAADFIDEVVRASGARAQSEYAVLLARKKQDDPAATIVQPWESGYYSEQVRKSNYDFDSQSVRPYLPYERVKEGVLGLTSRLFGVEFRQVKDAPVWHESVDCYEMYEGGKLVGRFYLDMHPRDGKYNHAAQFDIRTGIEGRQIPEAALVCNFPGGEPNDPGLMEHSDVVTFLHEFGHLIHTLFAGHQPWCGIGGIRTEWDFVEAPSQMLEEWAWDPAVLRTFAKQYETGEPIPVELVQQMKRADEFGKGMRVRRQMVYAQISLSFYREDPATIDTDALVRDITARYQPFPYVDGTHMQCAFGHLGGYSAIYYTYMWSLVISKDMFAQFDPNDLLKPGVAVRYRNTVLAAAGTKPAADMLKDFLGRPFNSEAWQRWLNQPE
jgi:Zn-dependent oligopeptidase